MLRRFSNRRSMCAFLRFILLSFGVLNVISSNKQLYWNMVIPDHNPDVSGKINSRCHHRPWPPINALENKKQQKDQEDKNGQSKHVSQ
jgi:hypothetical protein